MRISTFKTFSKFVQEHSCRHLTNKCKLVLWDHIQNYNGDSYNPKDESYKVYEGDVNSWVPERLTIEEAQQQRSETHVLHVHANLYLVYWF